MMHVLTTDRRAKSQLSLLLHDLGYPPKFVADLSELSESLSNSVDVKSILLDIQDATDELALEVLKQTQPKLRLIGFDLFERKLATQADYPKALDSCIVIPSHAERAKARLKSALAVSNPNATAIKRSGLTRPPMAFKRPASKFSVKSALRTKMSTVPTAEAAPTAAQYMTAISSVAKAFVSQLKAETADRNVVILTGGEGAEFELAARELNFQVNADRTPLHVLTSDDLSLDILEKVERAAAKAQTPAYCYIGQTDDLDETSALEVSLFLEYLENLRNPHLRIILAHQDGCESFFKEGVAEVVQGIRGKRPATVVPSLDERAEDIPSICNALLASLRTAHPFLLVSSITEDAIQHLVDSRADFSHSKLVRTLRNAIGLSQRTALCIEDLKNYGESDTTTQHLLESMADEGFFPTAEAANS